MNTAHKPLRKINMTDGPIFSAIIRYTLPIMLSSILQLLFNAADLVVVGRFCSDLCVGAVGATGSLVNLITNLFIGCGAGVAVCTANAIGSGNKDLTEKIVHTAIPLAAILGLSMSVIGLLFSGPLLKMMSTPADILPLSTLYLEIYFLGAVPNFLFEFGAAILRASGDTKTPMKYLIIAGMTNLCLNVVFVTLFGMDVDGVATATVIAQTLSATLMILTLLNRKDECRLVLKKMKIRLAILKKVAKIGLPAGFNGSIFSISNMIVQASINSFDNPAIVSGNAAAASIEGFVYVAMNAFYQTSLNFTGQNMGAGNFKRVSRVLRRNLICVTCVGTLGGLAINIFSKALLSLYVPGNEIAIEAGITRLSYIALFYALCGIMEVFTGAVRGMGASLTTLFISISSVCGIRIMWIFTVFQMPKFHTLDSLYVSYIFSWCGCILALFVAYNIINKHKKRVYEQRIKERPKSFEK
ncbi:MAG: MATE family efflux transporter [Clostridia bacterium]|nr:MATE family efflux transporter [Clostridia bacterium]